MLFYAKYTPSLIMAKISVRLKHGVKKQLDVIAKAKGVPTSKLVKDRLVVVAKRKQAK